MNEDKATSFSAITLLVLKELRIERNIHQAQVAEICGKTPSAWTKIESGKSPLTMEVFFKVCVSLNVAASSVLATTERYAVLFSQNHWGVVSQQLPFEEDALLKEAQEYYASAGFRARPPVSTWNTYVSILNGPIYNQNGTVSLAQVVHFALDKNFKKQQIEYTPGNLFN